MVVSSTFCTENSLYLINKDRQDIYLYDFFSLFLGVQSAAEVGPTSYETPYVYAYLKIKRNQLHFAIRQLVLEKEDSQQSRRQLSVWRVDFNVKRKIEKQRVRYMYFAVLGQFSPKMTKNAARAGKKNYPTCTIC